MGLDWSCSALRRGEMGGYGDILGLIDIVLGGVALQAVALDIRFGVGVAGGTRDEEEGSAEDGQ